MTFQAKNLQNPRRVGKYMESKAEMNLVPIRKVNSKGQIGTLLEKI